MIVARIGEGMKKSFLNIVLIVSVLFLIYILISNPALCKMGVATGVLLCGRVIIPSLFPFTVCVLFLMNSGALMGLKSLFRFKKRDSFERFFIVLLSFIGGYPIGAKLLGNAVAEKSISPKRAGNMLNFCVNAGPAFIISAIGCGILNSKKTGIILLASHILSGIVLILISNLKLSDYDCHNRLKYPKLNIADSFVKSVADASATVLNICGFVILFSAINGYLNYYSENISAIKSVALLLEITNAVTITNNVYLISFLLGFGGISVWCQVISVFGRIKFSFIKFLIFRILHGVLSVGFTVLLLKIFPVNVAVFSNVKSTTFTYFYSTAAVGISMLVMGLVFIISVSGKKYVDKLLEDMI